MPPTEKGLITITERLAERKGWRKQKMLEGTSRAGDYWVTGPEKCPKVERAVSTYNPTEDLNQIIEEVPLQYVLYHDPLDSYWWVFSDTLDYRAALAVHKSLAVAVCRALVGWDDELGVTTK